MRKIEELLMTVRAIHPELRVCQIMSIAANKAGWHNNDLFYIPDETLGDGLMQIIKGSYSPCEIMPSKTIDNLKVPGYRGRWYEIDRMRVGAITYVLLEHCTYGDETCALVIKLLSDSEFELVCETYDDIKTALEDEGIYEDE